MNMNRRDFIKHAVTVATLAGPAPALSFGDDSGRSLAKRPNIVLFMTDDQGRYASRPTEPVRLPQD